MSGDSAACTTAQLRAQCARNARDERFRATRCRACQTVQFFDLGSLRSELDRPHFLGRWKLKYLCHITHHKSFPYLLLYSIRNGRLGSNIAGINFQAIA
jgi:hypothetical protein